MNHEELLKKRAAYMNQEKITMAGSPEDPEHWVYKLKDTGVIVRDFEVDSGLGGEPVEICVIADMHINWLNQEDEQNEELLDTREHRYWNANAASIRSTERSMKFAENYDQTVIVGDTLDFLSKGGMELMEKYVWQVDPSVLVCLGGHDVTREMQTGKPDKEPLEARYAEVERFWHHDIYYVTKVLNNKVKLVVMDNGQGHYWARQVDLLRKDIAQAKKDRIPLIIFQHEPICSHNPEEAPMTAIRGNDEGNCADFCNRFIGSKPIDEATDEIYRMITENADVVKAVAVGHWHSDYVSHIVASFTDENGRKQPAFIPQLVLTCNVYENYAGNVLRLKVK